MTVVQAMNGKLGQWCVFPWIQEHSHFSLYLCPSGMSVSQISYLLILFISFQSRINRKAQPDYIKTGAPILAQGFPFAFYPQELIFFPEDFYLLPWWWTKKPLKWKYSLPLNQGCSISHSRISRESIRKNKRFRANVQVGIVESERYRKLQQRKTIAKKHAKTTDFIKYRKVQKMWIQ